MITEITKAIENHFLRREKMIQLYMNYKGFNLPIESKTVSKTSKVNSKLKNNYRGIIIDQSVGYLYGNSMSFGIDDLVYGEILGKTYNREIQKFALASSFDDVKQEVGKLASICGYSGWLVYTESIVPLRKVQEKVMYIPPWECIFDVQTPEGLVNIRYYPEERLETLDADEVYKYRTNEKIIVEVYTDKERIVYHQNAKGGLTLKERKNHNFDYRPLIKNKNNEEELGDFEKVETKIDAYDRVMSNMQDEIEQFRLAYMMMTFDVTEKELEKFIETGAFFDLDKDDRIEFLTKQINDTFIENHKKTLNDDIYKFSASIDFNDEKFSSGGAESGEARKWKLIALENKAIVKERKMSASLRELFKVLCSSWNKRGFNIDYLDIHWNFSRNIPVDLLYLADVSMKLKGNVSEDTRLSALSPLVDDVKWEKEKMAEDNQDFLDLTKPILPVGNE